MSFSSKSGVGIQIRPHKAKKIYDSSYGEKINQNYYLDAFFI